MNFLSRISTLYHERKKTFIAVCAFGTILFFGLLASMLLPSSPQTQTREAEEAGEITGTPEDTVQQKMRDVKYSSFKPTDIPFITKEDIEPRPPTPTPTPLPGNFYTANGQQNDLRIRLYSHQKGNSLYEVQLINSRTREIRVIGYAYAYSPGDSAFFSRDFSQIIFIGGSKRDYQQIAFYSIPQNKIVKTVQLADIKKALPTIKTDTTSILSSMYASPDKTKVALSYGNTFSRKRIVPNTNIIVINLKTNTMRLLPQKGLVTSWKDDSTIQYDVNTTNPAVNNTLEITND